MWYLTLSMLYIIIPYFVHFHNYLLYKILVLLQRSVIPNYSLTHRDKAEDLLVLGLLVNQSRLIFVELCCRQTQLCIFFTFFFFRGRCYIFNSNKYFTLSPIRILCSKVKLNKWTCLLRGQMKLWSRKTSPLVSSCCCCTWTHLIGNDTTLTQPSWRSIPL